MKKAFTETLALINDLKQDLVFQQTVEKAAKLLSGVLRNGNKILWCGNGGSAADCQHLSAELLAKLNHIRPALASLALTTDTSFLTAWINDTNKSEELFSRQIEGLAQEGDCLIALSTSGNSENIIKALDAANVMGLKSLALLGKNGGQAKGMATLELIVPSDNTQRIQEIHMIIGHTLCEYIEEDFLS